MNPKYLWFEGYILTSATVLYLIGGIMFILLDVKKTPNKYLFLGMIDYFMIQLPIYAALAVFFAEIFEIIIPHLIHLIIGFSLVPFTLLIWLYLFTRICRNRSTLIIILTVILISIFQGCFWYYLITDISMLAVPAISLHITFGPILSIFFLISLAYYLITGYFFIKKTDLKKHNTDLVVTGELVFMSNIIAIGYYFLLTIYFALYFLVFSFLITAYFVFHTTRISIAKGTYEGLQ